MKRLRELHEPTIGGGVYYCCYILHLKNLIRKTGCFQDLAQSKR
jgi:hypothetical protein